MTQNKHTLAPWVAITERGVAVMQKDSTKAICCPYISNSGKTGLSIEEAQANAHLIAAAPELLEALEMFVYPKLKNEGTLPDEEGYGELSKPDIWKAKQAIAKARGE